VDGLAGSGVSVEDDPKRTFFGVSLSQQDVCSDPLGQ
jgi:hypothetical protein